MFFYCGVRKSTTLKIIPAKKYSYLQRAENTICVKLGCTYLESCKLNKLNKYPEQLQAAV